ncbi:hypothetical protein ES703_69080 [subsurface metagenome]
MVKIVNPLGDVKIGRQGEVVYQRKYGEQIRRQASPKRAIASEAQLAHRQLYRAALDWRKLLSLPNRRYLEGYCYANGIVDSYHIPLAWSRFALKLYLQAVKFVVIEKPTFTYEKGEKKFEAYDNEGLFDGFFYTQWDWWIGQSFTPLETHKLSKVQLFIRRKGSLTDVTIGLRNTDGEGKPVPPDLATFVFAGNTLPTSFIWKEIPLVYDSAELGVKYAIYLKHLQGSTSNRVELAADNSSPIYTRGDALYSGDNGTSWLVRVTSDHGFREFGEYETEVRTSGLLHVRHPALMSVVHKRGELTVREYDTLSSLDEEYLTGQVGLDVEVGDTIEATTLPGISYRYQAK